MGSVVLPARGLCLVLLICLAWAGNFLASASALQHFPPFVFTALRLILVLIFLVRFLQPVPPALRKRLALVLTGVLIVALRGAVRARR